MRNFGAGDGDDHGCATDDRCATDDEHSADERGRGPGSTP